MRLVVVALAVSLTLVPLATEAQQTRKVYRVGVLVSVASSVAADLFQVLRQGLRELGYVDGRNLALEFRYAETVPRMAESAAELVRLNVDAIVATTTVPALDAKRATSTIPIVMIASADPVAAGLVASLARPGGNVTGSAVLTPELSVKQLEFLPEPMFFAQFPRIAEFAVKNHLPSISLIREFAAAGGLASYGPSYRHLLTRAAFFVDKILRGARPSDLPVEQPTRFDLVINLKTARALGLTVPRTLLLRADQVIE